MAFAQMNTEGFSDNELDTLNNALATLQNSHPGVDESNIADLLHNNFYEGIAEDELIAVVENRFKGL